MDGPLGDEGSPSVLRIEKAFFCQLGNRFAHSLTADMVLFGEHVLRRDFIAGVPCSADDFLFYFVFYVTEFGFFHIGLLFCENEGIDMSALPDVRLCEPGLGGTAGRFPLGLELREASGQPILSAKASRIDLSLLSVAQGESSGSPTQFWHAVRFLDGSLDIGSAKIYNLIFYSSDIFYQVHPLTIFLESLLLLNVHNKSAFREL